MSIYKLYGKVAINDNGNLIEREITDLVNYPEMTYSDLVLGGSESKEVPLGTISTCKYLYLETDKTCSVTLENGSDSISLTIDTVLFISGTELTKITITAGAGGCVVKVLVAGE